MCGFMLGFFFGSGEVPGAGTPTLFGSYLAYNILKLKSFSFGIFD